MKDKSKGKKSKRAAKAAARLRILLGTDLCACGAGHSLRCAGVCRAAHRDPATRVVKCGEMYRVEPPRQNDRRGRKPRRFHVKPTPDPKTEARQRFTEKRGV